MAEFWLMIQSETMLALPGLRIRAPPAPPLPTRGWLMFLQRAGQVTTLGSVNRTASPALNQLYPLQRESSHGP